LGAVNPAELDGLWTCEERLWRERLLWDRADTFATLRRVAERGAVPGKAVRVEARTVGYTYYVVQGPLGVIAGLNVSSEWSSLPVGGTLVQATVDDLRHRGVTRIETQFVAIDYPWLLPAFEHEGFRSAWREFQRLELCPVPGPASAPAMVHLEPWRQAHVHEAAPIMHAAYDGSVDAVMNALYRTADGCRVVLENLLRQGGSGLLVDEASALARHRERGIGFVAVTETASHQAHLAQVAVLPEFQGRGVGRLLLDYSLSRLGQRRFETLSLIVSRANHRALRMYQTMGFQRILSFPVFLWER
jgi:ribosomal protein S18 acetylase RimI-like enzyme